MTKTTITKSLNPVNLLIYLIIFSGLVFTLLPIAFMFTASMMPSKDILRMPYPWIPKGIHSENFIKAVVGNDGSYIFIRNFLNSMLVSGVVTFTTVILSCLSGYGLAKFRFKGRNIVFLAIMATMMIPFEAIMIPLYLVATKLHLQNSYGGLTLPFLVNAFGVFMMRQYLLPFPDEFLDATRIDGAGEIRIFTSIVLPNCAPAIATLSILTFRSQWDNLLWPLLVAQSEKMKTLPLYIVKFAAEKYTDEGAMMAVAVLASIPMLIMFMTMSRYFVSGASVFSSRKG